jgi:hypothetical protein
MSRPCKKANRSRDAEEAPLHEESTTDLGMKVNDGPAPCKIGGTHRTDLVTQVNGMALFGYAGPVVTEVLLRVVMAVPW